MTYEIEETKFLVNIDDNASKHNSVTIIIISADDNISIRWTKRDDIYDGGDYFFFLYRPSTRKDYSVTKMQRS